MPKIVSINVDASDVNNMEASTSDVEFDVLEFVEDELAEKEIELVYTRDLLNKLFKHANIRDDEIKMLMEWARGKPLAHIAREKGVSRTRISQKLKNLIGRLQRAACELGETDDKYYRFRRKGGASKCAHQHKYVKALLKFLSLISQKE